MSILALSDLRVIEWGEYLSGPYCGKLLAGLGAEVIKIERPGIGDRARRQGPFPNDIPHHEKSGTFLFINMNKLGITLDITSVSGARIFRELIGQADILVENNPPHLVEELGFSYNNLRKINPRLVMTSITAFGQTGPYRDFRSCHLVSFNMSGMAYINPSDGVYDINREPPLMGPPNQGDLVAGLTGAIGTLSAIFARSLTGAGQHVDVSQQEALASMTRDQLGGHINENRPWIRAKEKRDRAVSEIYHCKDGMVYLNCNQERIWERWVQAMGNPDWAQTELFSDRESRRANWDAGKALIEEWTSKYTVDEVDAIAEAARVPCRPINTVRESVSSKLLAAREFFVELDHQAAGRFKYPGAPYKLSSTPCQAVRSAPLLGEHNELVYCGRLGYSRQDLIVLRAQGVI